MRLYQATIVSRKDTNDRVHWYVVAKDVPEAVSAIIPQIQNVPEEHYDLEELKLLGRDEHNLIITPGAP